MDTMRALLLGAVTNSSAQTDQGRLVLLLLRLDNGVVDALQITGGQSGQKNMYSRLDMTY